MVSVPPTFFVLLSGLHDQRLLKPAKPYHQALPSVLCPTRLPTPETCVQEQILANHRAACGWIRVCLRPRPPHVPDIGPYPRPFRGKGILRVGGASNGAQGKADRCGRRQVSLSARPSSFCCFPVAFVVRYTRHHRLPENISNSLIRQLFFVLVICELPIGALIAAKIFSLSKHSRSPTTIIETTR